MTEPHENIKLFDIRPVAAGPGTWTDRLGRDRTPSVPGHEVAGVVSADHPEYKDLIDSRFPGHATVPDRAPRERAN
jgi:hypothetical protein